MPTLKDVIKEYERNAIFLAYCEKYGKDGSVIKDLSLIIDFLQNTEQNKASSSFKKMTIVKRESRIAGIYNGDTELHALGFLSWNEWLTSDVAENTLDFVCDCIYEMTYYGPDDSFQVNLGRPIKQKGRNLIAIL
jgi:hypothetical protein